MLKSELPVCLHWITADSDNLGTRVDELSIGITK
jgi:hypothetical protein